MKKYLLPLVVLLIAVPVMASETLPATISTGVSTGIEGSVAATPTASPLPGTYTSGQDVILTAASANSIHYIIDGASPTCSTGTPFSGHIDVDSSLTIRAIGCYNGTPSSVGIFAYGINLPAPPSPPFGGGGTPPPSTPAQANGDITGPSGTPDNVVGLLDFNALVLAWGSTGASLPADLDHNGVVDLLDFNILVFNWTI